MVDRGIELPGRAHFRLSRHLLTPSRVPRQFTAVARNLGLALGSLLASLLLCELLLRLLGVSFPVYVWTDPIRGVAHIPGMQSAALPGRNKPTHLIEINSQGWRGPEVSLKHPAGVFRIALLGDSFIEAFEVPFDKTVGEVIARRLSASRGSPVEVLNFGHGGYGTTQELLTLQHDVWKYSPDLVLLAVTTGNDVSDNFRALRQADNVPYHVYRGTELVLDTSFLQAPGYRSRALWTRRLSGVIRYSRLAQLINRVRHLRRRRAIQRANADAAPGDEIGLRDEVHVPPKTPDWKEAWRVTEGVLGLMQEECRKHNTPFALVTLTRGIQVTLVPGKKEEFLRELGAKDLYYPEHRLQEFGARRQIPVLNLAPMMARQAEARHVWFHADRDSLGVGHWNAAGHEAAGELIAPWLAREVIPRSPDFTAQTTP
jgi:hypothetical protein